MVPLKSRKLFVSAKSLKDNVGYVKHQTWCPGMINRVKKWKLKNLFLLTDRMSFSDFNQTQIMRYHRKPSSDTLEFKLQRVKSVMVW